MEDLEIDYIQKHFDEYFKLNNFQLYSSDEDLIVFANKCCYLLFKYDLRYIRQFDAIVIRRISDDKEFIVFELLQVLSQNSIEKQFKSLVRGENGDLIRTDIQAYSILIKKYIPDLSVVCDFAWDANYEEHMNNLFPDF